MIPRCAGGLLIATLVVACSDSNDPVLPPAPTAITWGAVAFTDQRGTSGGTAYPDACPDGEAVTGYRGDFHMDGYLGQIQAICSSLTLSTLGAPVVALTAGTTLPLRGGPFGVGEWTAVCPTRHVVIGFGGRSGGLIDQLIIRCAPIAISAPADAYVIALGTPMDLDPVGTDGGSAFDQTDCPAGSMAVVSNIRASDGVVAFGLGCSEPALEF